MHIATLRRRLIEVREAIDAAVVADEAGDQLGAADIMEAAARRLGDIDRGAPRPAWSPLAWVVRGEALGEVVNGVRRAPVNEGALVDWAAARRVTVRDRALAAS